MNKTYKYTLLSALGCLTPVMVMHAAVPIYSLITLERCIEVAMEQNYDVRIASNTLNVAENNVTLAPFLPTVDFTSEQTASTTNSNEYTANQVLEGSQSSTATWKNSLDLEWILFDGMAMFATREKQRVLLSQGRYRFQSVVENLVKSLSMQYFYIISLQNQVNLLQELVSISQLRYQQALTRYRIGSDSGLEYKQAKIYLNSDSSSLLLKKETLKNAYIELNQLMNVPLASNYLIRDTILPDNQLQMDQLMAVALTNNTSLQAIKAGEQVALLDTRLAKAERYPTLYASAGYELTLSKTPYLAGKYDESNEPSVGLTLSVPLFDQLETNRKIKNAVLNQKNATLEIEQMQQEVESELLQQYNSYTNNLRMIDFEEESREAASLNLEAAMEKYRLGSLSGIEFRDYQVSYMNASDRKLDALYQTKISEITLRLLAGELFGQKGSGRTK